MLSMRYAIAIIIIILLLWKIIYNLRKNISADNIPKTLGDIHKRLGRVEIYFATLIVIKLLSSLYNLSAHEAENGKNE